MSYEIRHSFVLNALPEAIADALMKEEHIQRWWTKDARVENGKGVFGWDGYGWTVHLDMEQDGSKRVQWKCTQSNMENTQAWEGTTITFDLGPGTGGTRLAFAQTDYKESPCHEACTQGWAFFIGTSLKQYVETGKGIPYPEMQNTSAA
jgi:hypothetical protein